MKGRNDHIDPAIIERVRQGDVPGFRLIIETYKDRCFSLACSVLKNEQAAEDALQEAFIKVYKNIGSFKGNASFSTWLYRIVINTCYTQAKKYKHVQLQEDEPFEGLEVYDDAQTGLDQLMVSERKVMLHKALQSMKTDEALLLKLYYLSELETKEIMEVTGFTEPKIKTTLHRARKSLLARLQQLLGNEWKMIK